MTKIPMPIWYIAAFLVFVTLIYFICNPAITHDIFGKGNFTIPEEGNKSVVQLKGQLFINGKSAEGYQIKIKEYSDSDDKTKTEGKFEIKGIPYASFQQVINIQIKCPETDQYIDIGRKDLTNVSQFPISKSGWVDLGTLDIPDDKCPQKTPSAKMEEKKDNETKTEERHFSTPPSPTEPHISEKTRLAYYSKTTQNYEFTRVTLNGDNVTIDPGMTISVYVKKGDILVFTKTNGQPDKIIIKQ